METILKEFEKLQENGQLSKCQGLVDDLLDTLMKSRTQIEQGDVNNIDAYLKLLKSKVDTYTKRAKLHQKEIHGPLSRFGKSLDKSFKTNFSSAYQAPTFLKSNEEALNKAISMHFVRNGNFEVAQVFMNESGGSYVSDTTIAQFEAMFVILHSLKNNNLGPAIAWASDNRDYLKHRGSDLEFNLHKCQFVRLLLDPENSPSVVLNYARTKFGVFSDIYLSEISRLMTSLLYRHELDLSPYANLRYSPSFEEICQSFTNEYCASIGFSSDSPLYLAVTAGSAALPILAKMGSIMKLKRAEWSSLNELPVEIELPKKFQFHPIFVCPVSKEQTTDLNPPRMLVCGHIISQESLNAISRNRSNSKFKCPYCPSECTALEAKRVYFE
ncbi:hypothetical protein NADFUDRAFT_82526 [Nadsonia fulvescens var. elongata DSM 6958]|uniref:GID complex catalytic subunit 2 n=1 Tax=Nadsonia fulvescens var. elongata DSM 6958 TaxID=857566 RepID=A0A1E3PN00_9ASCO|nr:hypothetical protein NADFUDRAFT_82526 [Nadsonia fulvescens var. elongata DSM 6958]